MDHQEFFGQGIGLKGYFASIQDRWEGWVTRTKVTGYSTVQGKVLHSNGVSCFSEVHAGSYCDIQTLISVGCNQPHPYTST